MVDLLLLSILQLSINVAPGCPNTTINYPSSLTVEQAIDVAKGAHRYCNRQRHARDGSLYTLPYCAKEATIVKHDTEINHMGVSVKCFPAPGPNGWKVEKTKYEGEQFADF